MIFIIIADIDIKRRIIAFRGRWKNYEIKAKPRKIMKLKPKAKIKAKPIK